MGIPRKKGLSKNLSLDYLLLTEKDKKVVDHFIASGDLKNSLKEAGYVNVGKDRQAVIYERLSEIIDYRMELVAKASIADAEEIQQFLTKVMRAEEEDEVIMYEGGLPSLHKKRPAMKDRLKSAEHLGKAKGMFVENRNVSSDLQVRFVMDYGDEEEYKQALPDPDDPEILEGD